MKMTRVWAMPSHETFLIPPHFERNTQEGSAINFDGAGVAFVCPNEPRDVDRGMTLGMRREKLKEHTCGTCYNTCFNTATLRAHLVHYGVFHMMKDGLMDKRID